MLSASPLGNSCTTFDNIKEGEASPIGFGDFCIDDNFLDYIDFSSEPFEGFDGEVLPDLEVDPADIFADFCTATCDETAGKEETAVKTKVSTNTQEEIINDITKIEETATKDDESSVTVSETKCSSTSGEEESKRKPSTTVASAKSSQGKRKVKVDWTPELHRRFVNAVEQLGIDKAVPSKILELMGIDCLTRHNVASHLQKYRSHRKHLLAREAEAASWSQRRQMYQTAVPTASTAKKDPWMSLTIGFPPPPPTTPPMQTFHPLHVWGHPTAPDPSTAHAWPRHVPPRPPVLPWAGHTALPMGDPSYWHHHYHPAAKQGWTPHMMPHGSPYFHQPLAPVRFPIAPVPGVLPHPMFRPVPPLPAKQSTPQIQLDFHPSKESIDAAIGDVLAKPWSPLPLGLKPPSTDSVLVELHRQGISKVPPAKS